MTESREAEFYRTPYSAVRALVESGHVPITGRWLEPCAGDGAIIRAIPEIRWEAASELRISERLKLRGMAEILRVRCPLDLFSDEAKGWVMDVNPDVVCTNWPNSKGAPLTRLFRDWLPHSWLVVLQPLGFLRTIDAEMNLWLVDNQPDCLRLQERPAFLAQGGAADYAWWVWPPHPLKNRAIKDGWRHVGRWVRQRGTFRTLSPKIGPERQEALSWV